MGNATSGEGDAKGTSYAERLAAAVNSAMDAKGRERKQRIVQVMDLMIGNEEFAALCAVHPEFRSTVISKVYEFHLELAVGDEAYEIHPEPAVGDEGNEDDEAYEFHHKAHEDDEAYEFHDEAYEDDDEGVTDTLRVRVVQFMCEYCPELL